ncbi:hypothetical protein DFH08DRAFT_868677 [Mycena albidolilacea]|uniref:Uncharacterized protein n=1 Tax=Mycena albidolilacea TaxID=1033008 RepID=A0AAD6ZZH3_9AGAR|nr:hypothetical protein DFH08DRAFT_868677 [Mycena albidolilacea]
MMSDSGGVLNPILMRSSTPGPNEKVLSYLEGMSREGHEADDTPPRSIADAEDYQNQQTRNGLYSPAARSRNSEALRDLAMSPVSYTGRLNEFARPTLIDDDGDDTDSLEQNGQRSEFGGQPLPIREPGPNDAPGPHYPSYDSGPSFGNFGPMPDEPNNFNEVIMSTWTPNWAQQYNKPMPELPELSIGGLTPGHVKAALPESAASPRATSVNIGVESPSSPRSRPVPSQASRQPSKAAEDNRPWSPMSRVTTKTKEGTAYPALPESRMGENDFGSPASPTRSKAQSTAKSPSRKEPSNANRSVHGGADPEVGAASPPRNIASPMRSTFSGNGQSHQNRPFSPYRHAPTTEDLLHAAVRGRAVALDALNQQSPASLHSRAPSAVPSKAPSAAPSAARSHHTAQSHHGKAASVAQSSKAASAVEQGRAATSQHRAQSPFELNQEEAQIVKDALAGRTPRTSHYTPSALGSDIVNSHFHDMDLCVLMQQESDPTVHEVVKKALRKAIRQRVKRLGMKYDNESIKQYKKMHDHDPSVHLNPDDLNEDEPPKWAADLKREIVLMQQRIESLGPKIEGLRAPSQAEGSKYGYEGEPGQYTETPATRTINIHAQPTGTLADSMYQHPETELVVEDDEGGSDDATETPQREHPLRTESDGLSQHHNVVERDDSPGQQFLEEELYKLRQKRQGSNLSHHSWEVTRDGDDDADYEDEHEGHGPSPTGLQTIPDRDSNAAEPAPVEEDVHQEIVATPQQWHADVSGDQQHLPPWQRIHQRLLSWAIIWPAADFDAALNSTTRNQQVNEVALTIWSMQTYKRYVRAKLTDSPQGVVDRLFVPPNMADAISNAVFNGRHGDACGMLRDLWSPFGLEGMPRLLIVLAKHRSDPNHWVVHRFSLPEGALTTYDSYPERTLPDGRPLGWWFAIRVAWPNAIYPSPDHLMQKMVRLHRPLQLGIDNSVAACGLWRNILMGSRAERSLDLERLRDLINTEVKNLRQKKQIGKLSIGAPRPVWDFTMGQ